MAATPLPGFCLRWSAHSRQDCSRPVPLGPQPSTPLPVPGVRLTCPVRAATEFEAAWRGLASDLQGQGSLLLSLPADRLPHILQHALTPVLLEGMARALLVAALLDGDFQGPGQLLAALTRVPRFSMTILGLPARRKQELGRLWTGAAAVDEGGALGQLRQQFRV